MRVESADDDDDDDDDCRPGWSCNAAAAPAIDTAAAATQLADDGQTTRPARRSLITRHNDADHPLSRCLLIISLLKSDSHVQN